MSKRMKILIGYDGSTYANAALDDLRRAGLPPEGDAVVVSVGAILFNLPLASHELIEKSLSPGRATSATDLTHEQEKQPMGEAHGLATEAAHRVEEYLPGWKVFPKALTGTPSDELLREAQFLDADLIVVGSRGLSALGRLFLGSVSKSVASLAHCSVRIARPSTEKIKRPAALRIIVGVDGSTGAARAVRAIGMRSWPVGTELRLIAVDDGNSSTGIKDDAPGLEELVTGFNEGPPVNARLMAEGAEMVLLAEGLNVSVEIMEGDPQGVLIEEAQKWKADCLFVGARGMESETAESRLGSVSAKLVTGAHCSVELVR